MKRPLQTSILFLILVASLVILPSIPEVEVAKAAGENWLAGWTYRKSHVIQSASGAGTNYQIKITVHYGSGTDSGEHVYLNGHSRTDFGDVRFTDDDGVTLLDYWMETYVDSDYAIFWVEIADNLSASDATIYIYYGKSDATTTSNGTATFIFFEDFDDGDASDWTFYQSVAIYHGEIDTAHYHSASYSYRLWTSGSQGYYGYCEIYRSVDFDGSTVKVDVYERHDSNGVTDSFFGKVLIDSTEIISFDLGTDRNQWISRSGSTTPSAGSHTLRLRFRTDPSSGDLTQIWWDDIRIRKYVDPEPQHGSWGTEKKNAIIGDFEAPSPVSPDEYFLLNATIIAPSSVTEFINATVELEGGIILKWDNSTDSFTEYQDTNGYCTLDASGSFKTQLNSTSYKLSWRIKLSSSFPKGYTDVVDAHVYATNGLHGQNSHSSLFYFSTYDGWWSTDWQKRKPIIVTENSGTNLTSYQIALNVTYDGDMRSDFGDLRFTWVNETASAEVPLDYWVEDKSDGSWAYVWVKIPEIPANSNVTIYMYYGNPSATSESNASATFIFFEDFDDGDASDWTYYESVSIYYGEIDTAHYHSALYSYRLWSNGPCGYYGYCEIYRSIDFDGSTVKVDVYERHDSNGLTDHFFGKVLIDSTEIISFDLGTDRNQWISRSSSSTTPSAGSHTLRLRYRTDPSSDDLTQIWWDDIRIRKYVSPEPSATFGSEESTPAPSVSGFEAPSLVHADEYFLLNMTILDLDGVNDFVNATITLEGNVTLKWDSATDSFSELSDPNNYVTLDASGSFKTQLSTTSLKLSWRIKLSSSYPSGSTDVVDADVYDSEGFHGTSSESGLFYFTTYDGWWSTDWQKRKPINITENSGTTLTNYAVAMNITYDDDMQADFDDLRFTIYNSTIDDEVPLDYYLESKSDGSWAYVWVKIPEIPANSNVTIYMYYGNPSATSESNASATFIFWDDFEQDRGWTYSETKAGFFGEYPATDDYYSPSTSYKIGLPSSTATSAGDYCQISKTIEFDGSQVKIEVRVKDSRDGAAANYHYKKIKLGDNVLWSSDAGSDTNEWQLVSVTTTPAAGTQSLALQLYEQNGVSNFGISVWWDDVKIRKYVSPEPSVTFGSEESAPVTNNAPSVSGFEAPSKVYAEQYFWLNVTVADADGVADLDYVTVQIGTIVLKWDSSGDVFSEQSDPSGLCTLDSSASTRMQLSSTSYKLSFRLKLSWSFPEGSVDVLATVYDASAASGSLSQAGLFTFEDDVIIQGCCFSTGSEITVKGHVYYEGTSIPPTSGVTVRAEYGGSVKAYTSSLTNGLFTLSWTESSSGLRNYTIYAVTDEPSVQNETLQAFSFFVDGQFRWGFSNDTISSFSWDDAQKRLNVTFSSPSNSTLYIHGRPTYILGGAFDLSTAYTGGWTRLDLNQSSSVTVAYPNWGDFYVRKLTAGEVTDAYWTEQVFTLVLNGTSGTSATLEIYCGSRGMPKSISGFTGEPTYDADTTILSGTVAYQSPVTVTLDFTMPVSSGSSAAGGPSSSSSGIPILPAVSLSIAPVEFVQLHPGETVTSMLNINFTGVNNIRVIAIEFSGAAADWITLAEPLPKTIFKPIGEEVGTGEIELRIVAPENAEPGDYTVPVLVKAEAVGSQIQANGYVTFSITPQTPPVSIVPEYMTWMFAAALVGIILYAYLKD